MATWYVNSAAAGTGAGTSWANACTTLTAAITLSAAGDDFNVLSTHAETAAAATTLTFKGTAASPNRVFSCDNTNSPATDADLVAGATVTTTGSGSIAINGYVYIYGMTFNMASAAGVMNICNGSYQQVFENCSIILSGSTTAPIDIGLSSGLAELRFINTTIKLGGAGQSIDMRGGRFFWSDTPAAIPGTVPTTLFTGNGEGILILDGVDLSALGSGHTIINGTATSSLVAQLRNCKLGASVTVASTPTAPAGVEVDLINCDSAATGYRQERYRYQGTLTTSTTVYNNASDGVTPISWHVVTTANATRQSPFECFEIVQWAAAGTYAASLVQITSATAALTNADVWVEAQYLGNGSFPISSLASSAPANQLTAGSALAAGTWATGGLGNNYKLALPSFTTALAGYIRFTVKIAKASLTLNIDPQVTVA